MKRKLYYLIGTLLFLLSMNSFAFDKMENISLYINIPKVYSVQDTKYVQSLSAYHGKFQIKDMSPYSQLHQIFKTQLKKHKYLNNYQVNSKKLYEWKSERNYSFGNITIKPKSIKLSKEILNDKDVRFMMLVEPGLEFFSKAGTNAQVYGNGIVYVNDSTNIFSSLLICIIDLKSESTVKCNRFFKSEIFSINENIDESRMAEIKEYISLDVIDADILSHLNNVIETKSQKKLSSQKFIKLYLEGLNKNDSFDGDVDGRVEYITELIRRPSDVIVPSMLYKHEGHITDKIINMLKQSLPEQFKELFDLAILNENNEENED